MSRPLDQLLTEVRSCRHCAAHLPHGPRPVVQVRASARLRIVGQAPGRKVHETGIPWNDASGKRLREWLGLAPEQFYDAGNGALMPMGFCYPGKAASVAAQPDLARAQPLIRARRRAGIARQGVRASPVSYPAAR